MKTCIENLINGKIHTAIKQAKRFKNWDLRESMVKHHGFSLETAIRAADFLKGRENWSAYFEAYSQVPSVPIIKSSEQMVVIYRRLFGPELLEAMQTIVRIIESTTPIDYPGVLLVARAAACSLAPKRWAGSCSS